MAITNVDTTRLTGSAYSAPSSAFKEFGLEITSTGALTSQKIDDIEAVQMLDTIYSFAQTKSASLPMLCGMQIPMSSGVLQYTREGNADWAVKAKAAATTPHTTIDYDTRVVLETLLDQGHLIDMDMQRRARFALTPRVQAKLTYALARNMDKLVQFAMTQDVSQWATVVNKSWAGARTVTNVAFKDSQRLVRTTKHATPAVAELYDTSSGNINGTQFFDNLVNLAEEANIAVENLIIIGSPELRRQLKRIADFRDDEVTVAYRGNENLNVVTWLDLNFLFLKRDAFYNGKEQFEDKRYGVDGDIVSTGGTAFAADLSAIKLETFLMVDMDSIVCGMPEGGNYSRVAKRMDQSDATELYMKVALAYGRMDESKIWQVIYKSRK